MTASAYSPFVGEQLAYWREHLDEPCFVYVVQAQAGTPIKIGTAKDPEARLRGLQTGNPELLRLLHIVPGDHKLEHEFHRRLKGSEVRGEWFAGKAVDGFLKWLKAFIPQTFKTFEREGRLPKAAPAPRKINRVGFQSWGWRRNEIGHHWRTMDKPDPNPVSIRFVEPSPLTDQELAERERRRKLEATLRRRPLPDDTWYPGKEEAA